MPLPYLPKSISTQPSLFCIHQVEEDGRGQLMKLSQDVPSGGESCDLEHPQGPRKGLKEKSGVSKHFLNYYYYFPSRRALMKQQIFKN